MTETDRLRAEVDRLRAERDALADRLREVRARLTDTIDRLSERVVMANWERVRKSACRDCHGMGYDASGQLCGCQENPSFG